MWEPLHRITIMHSEAGHNANAIVPTQSHTCPLTAGESSAILSQIKPSPPMLSDTKTAYSIDDSGGHGRDFETSLDKADAFSAMVTYKDECAIKVSLSPLQRLIREILDPLALNQRTIKEWQNLYKSFFAFFAPEGTASELERRAWCIAFEAFNKNLIAVNNRTTQVVPMTYQDCVDGIDSFKHDGLQENSQRDIVWQPKKILLLLAAMIGRVTAGWQADTALVDAPLDSLSPFQEYLIEANRQAAFLGYVFNYDPRFSILSYRAAGLKSVMHSFPHAAHALIENGVYRSELLPGAAPGNPPRLRVHFRRPLRVPVSAQSVTSLDLVLLRAPLPEVTTNGDTEVDRLSLECTNTVLEALTFEPNADAETKQNRIERLFELAILRHCLICSTHKVSAQKAGWISKTLGRTAAEQFVIEQFFALGFRSGAGNEPWRETGGNGSLSLDPDKLKEARKQFEHWRSTFSFFAPVGHPDAAGLAGARMRQEILQSKRNGPALYVPLLQTSIYTPLMDLLLAVDTQGRWLIDEADLGIFGKAINGNLGKVLAEGAEIIIRCADALPEREMKASFLYECALGIFFSIPKAQQGCLRRTNVEAVRDSLRKAYESSFKVSLADTPSVVQVNPLEHEALVAESRKRVEEIEQRIWNLLGEPFSQKVASTLKEARSALFDEWENLRARSLPLIQLETPALFAQSVAGLSDWIKRMHGQAQHNSLSGAEHLVASLAESRILSEEGKVLEALEKAAALVPLLSRKKKERLMPFFIGLSKLMLTCIEPQISKGQKETAIAWAEKIRILLEGTPTWEEFRVHLPNQLKSRPADKELTSTIPPATLVPGGRKVDARAQLAQTLLQEYADELLLGENSLEEEFLEAVANGTDKAFPRKKKLESRLEKLTHWGGREPHMTTLKLLRSVPM